METTPRMGPLGRAQSLFSPSSAKAQSVVIALAFVAYAFVQAPLQILTGGGTTILITIPTVIAAWLSGWRIGIVLSLMGFLLNSVLVSIQGQSWSEWAISGGIVGTLLLILLAWTVGLVSDLRRALARESALRLEAEDRLEIIKLNRESMDVVESLSTLSPETDTGLTESSGRRPRVGAVLDFAVILGVASFIVFTSARLDLFERLIPVFDRYAALQLDALFVGAAAISLIAAAILFIRWRTLSEQLNRRWIAESALRANQERLATLLDNAPVDIFSVSRDGIFSRTRGKIYRHWGSRETL